MTSVTVLLDSYCWFEYFFGSNAGKRVMAILESGEEVITSTIVVFEVFRKYLENKPGEARDKMLFLTTRAKITSVDEETAVLAAELAVRHRLHATDALIYATARKNSCKLLTGDKHFKDLVGVELL